MLRYAGVQLACTLVVAIAVFAITGPAAGPAAGLAVLVGGAIAAVGNVVFGWRLFQPGVAPVAVLARGFWAGELRKWLWVGFALWGALGPGHLAAWPLLAGLVAAQIGFWLGLALVR